MNEKILEKLEWPLLLESLSAYCHTEEAQASAKSLQPKLGRDAILANWQAVVPLRDLARQGYRAPIGSLSPVAAILKSAGIGQILEGKELRSVFHLLEATRNIAHFAQDLAARCPPLARIREVLHPLPGLAKAIDRAIDPEGQLNDEASPELADIRRQKRTLSRRIEQKLKEILNDPAWNLYLQDDFFTVRNERYVVPDQRITP